MSVPLSYMRLTVSPTPSSDPFLPPATSRSAETLDERVIRERPSRAVPPGESPSRSQTFQRLLAEGGAASRAAAPGPPRDTVKSLLADPGGGGAGGSNKGGGYPGAGAEDMAGKRSLAPRAPPDEAGGGRGFPPTAYGDRSGPGGGRGGGRGPMDDAPRAPGDDVGGGRGAFPNAFGDGSGGGGGRGGVRGPMDDGAGGRAIILRPTVEAGGGSLPMAARDAYGGEGGPMRDFPVRAAPGPDAPTNSSNSRAIVPRTAADAGGLRATGPRGSGEELVPRGPAEEGDGSDLPAVRRLQARLDREVERRHG
jgi:hypothetical protein